LLGYQRIPPAVGPDAPTIPGNAPCFARNALIQGGLAAENGASNGAPLLGTYRTLVLLTAAVRQDSFPRNTNTG